MLLTHKSGVGGHCDSCNDGPDDLPRADVLRPSGERSAVLVHDLHGVGADLDVVRYASQQLCHVGGSGGNGASREEKGRMGVFVME